MEGRLVMRLEAGYRLEPVPSICMCCGRPVDEFVRVRVQLGNKEHSVRMPLCAEDVDRLYVHDTSANVRGGGALGMAMAEHQNNQLAMAQTFTVDGVCVKFARELRQLRRQTEAEMLRDMAAGTLESKKPPRTTEGPNEFDAIFDDVPAPPRREPKPPTRGWTVGRFVALVVGFFVLMGAVGGIAFAVFNWKSELPPKEYPGPKFRGHPPKKAAIEGPARPLG